MIMKTRIGLHLVAGVGIVSLVGCAGGGDKTPAPAAPSTPSLPLLSQQPLDQTLPAGQTATFRVAATANGSLSYQWRKDGADLIGATASAYTTAALTAADTGIYTCRVTNTLNGSASAVTSSAANLAVNTPPAIAAQPISQPSYAPGDRISFSVAATGNGTLSFQWQKDGVNIPVGGNASAATATLILGSAQAGDAGTYTCVVTATLNGTTTTTVSAPAILGPGQVATINTQPATLQTKLLNDSVTFTVDAAPAGGGTLSYQWRKEGVEIPGATAASLTLDKVQYLDAGTYTCIVTNTIPGSASLRLSTVPAVLAVNLAPTVSAIAPQTSGEGGGATFAVAATKNGPGELSYQWLLNGQPIDGSLNPTALTPRLVVTGLLPAAADQYACVVSSNLNGTQASTTSTGTLTVNAGPVLVNPESQTLTEGLTAQSFKVAATGKGSLAYQWHENGTAIPVSGNASAATDTLLLPAITPALDGHRYHCVVTDTVNGVVATSISQEATLTVNRKPTFSTDVLSVGYNNQDVLAAGFSAAVTASAGSTISYEWFKVVAGGDLSMGAGSPLDPGSSLVLSGLTAANQAEQYYCVATAVLNGTTITAKSAVGTLIYNEAPVLTPSTQAPTGGTYKDPAVYTVNANNAVTLSLTAATPTLGTLNYQWYKIANADGVTRDAAVDTKVGTNAPIYTISSAKAKSNAGQGSAGNYYCVVTNAVPGTGVLTTTSSANLGLAVNWAPGLAPSSPAGTPIYLRETATTGGTYSWNTSSLASGATSQPTFDGTWSSSPLATLTYSWTKGNSATPLGDGVDASSTQISGTTTKSLSIGSGSNPIHLGVAGTYTCHVTNTLNGLVSPVADATPIPVSVLAAPTGIAYAPSTAQTIAKGSTLQLTVSASAPASQASDGSSAPTDLVYQWYLGTTKLTDGGSITGSSTATLTVSNIQTSQAGSYWCQVGGKAKSNGVYWNDGAADVVNYVPATSTSAPGNAIAVTVDTSVVTPIITLDAQLQAGMPFVASTQDQGAGITYAWTFKNGSGATLGTASTRVATFTAPASGTVTATVTATKTSSGANLSASKSASVLAAVKPQTVFSPATVHPGDDWMKAFAGVYGGESYLWSMLNGTGSSAINGADLHSPTARFSVDSAAANGSTLTLNANVQNGAEVLDAQATVTVKTGAWVTKDGGPLALIGQNPTATLLKGGRVLITGGFSSNIAMPTATCQIYDPATGRYLATGSMNQARYSHTATELDNGMVLVVGGYINNGSTATNTLEVWDPATGQWTLLNSSLYEQGTVGTAPSTPAFAAIGTGRGLYGHCAVKLANGKVALIGGKTTGTTPTNYFGYAGIQVFDPAQMAIDPALNVAMQIPRYQHTVSVLTDATSHGGQNNAGKILIAGGTAAKILNGTASTTTFAATSPNYQCEVYDPSANSGAGASYLTTNLLTNTYPRILHAASVLNDGSVLLSGGNTASTSYNSATIWNPGTLSGGTWGGTFNAPVTGMKGGITSLSTTPVLTGRQSHSSDLLADGTVLLAGGTRQGSGSGADWTVELFTPTGLTANPGAQYTGGTFSYTTSPGHQVFITAPNVSSTPASTTYSGHSMHASVVLPVSASFPSGGVLLVGGKTDSANLAATNTVELFQPNPTYPTAGPASITVTAGLDMGRMYHASVQLKGSGATAGKVMVIAGSGSLQGKDTATTPNRDYGNFLRSVRIYDPVTHTWTATGDLNLPRRHATALALSNGNVLVTGGQTDATSTSTADATAELWDRNTGTWTVVSGGMKAARMFHGMAELPNGDVLVIGGAPSSTGDYLNTCELYSGGAFNFTANLSEGKAFLEPVNLGAGNGTFNGSALIAGGQVKAGGVVTASAKVEVFTSTGVGTGTWATLATPLSTPRHVHTTTLLQDGRIALVGGLSDATTTWNGWDATGKVPTATAAEIYTVNTGTPNGATTGGIGSALFQTDGHRGARAILLDSGDVLLVGGPGKQGGMGTTGLTMNIGQFSEIFRCGGSNPTYTFVVTDALPIARKITPQASTGWEFTATPIKNTLPTPTTDVLVVGGKDADTITHIYRP